MVANRDIKTAMLLKCLMDFTPAVGNTLAKRQIMISKDKWGSQGPKKYYKSCSLITTSLKAKFGAYINLT